MVLNSLDRPPRAMVRRLRDDCRVPAPVFISLGYASYVGGLPGYRKSIRSQLWFTNSAIGLGGTSPSEVSIDVADVMAVEVQTIDEAKSRVGYVIAFGVLGLAAKNRKARTVIEVSVKPGDTAYFEVDHMHAIDVKRKLEPWRKQYLPIEKQPSMTEALPEPPSTCEPDMLGQLERLAALHSAGALTDGEFAAAKAKLLGL
jgi:hypothetical protein